MGLVAFSIWGLLGLGAALSGRWTLRLQPWMQAVGWMAVGWFGLGVGTSMLAAQINWGAVFWAEPRLQMAAFCWMAALAAHTINLWLPWPRIKGLMAALPGLYVTLSLWLTPLVLHPRKPVTGKDATPFLWAFGGLFGIALLLAVWLTYQLAHNNDALPRREQKRDDAQFGNARKMQ